jgi:hypothetical protein
MVFVVGQVGVGTQANGKQAAMQLSLRKDNHNWTVGPDGGGLSLRNYLYCLILLCGVAGC